MQRATSAVIRTASSKESAPEYAASTFSPKLGPVHTSGTKPSCPAAHSAEARQFTRKATCEASE